MSDVVNTIAVTLNPASPDVVISGTIDAYGAAGTYAGTTFHAAVFGPSDGNFHVHNRGFVESDGSLNTDLGILLGAAGHVVNSGDILAASGIAVFSTAAVGTLSRGDAPASAEIPEVFNEGKIHATLGLGVYLQDTGTVENTGVIKALQIGVKMEGGGYAVNAGTVTGETGILMLGTPGSYVYNTGFVKATTEDGILLVANGYVNNTGVIKAAHEGVLMAGGGSFYNSGKIQADRVGVVSYGGSVFNYAGGVISGAPFGVELSSAGFVYNAGSINGPGGKPGTVGAGVYLTQGGTVVNAASGRVTGLSGVVAEGGALTLLNDGVIYGTGGPNAPGAAAVYGAMGGDVVNNGTIQGGNGLISSVYGIVLNGAAGTVTNNGVMSGYFFGGAIEVDDGGVVVNTGTIREFGRDGGGIYLRNGGSVINSGYISGPHALYATGGADVTNTGTVHGAVQMVGGGVLKNFGDIGNYAGVFVYGGGTVFNAGTISGTYQAIYFQPGSNNELILKPGSVLMGSVYGGHGVLDLARGTVMGTINLNQEVYGFSTVVVGRGAEWGVVSSDFDAVVTGVDNDGTLMALGSLGLTLDAPLFGKGTVDSGMGDLTLNGRVGKNESVVLGGPNETLSVGVASAFAGAIESFASGDALVLTGVAASLVTGISFSDGVLTVSESSSSYTFTFSNPGSFAHERFSFFRDHGDAGITLTPRGKMSFVAPASAAAADSAAVQLPAVSYVPRAASAVPSSVGHMGWMDSVTRHDLGALVPVVTLQG